MAGGVVGGSSVVNAPGDGTSDGPRSSTEIGCGPPRAIGVWQEQWRQLLLQAWAVECDCRRQAQGGNGVALGTFSACSRALTREQATELKAESVQLSDETKQWESDLWSGLARCRKRMGVLACNVQFAPRGADDIKSMVHSVERDVRIYAEQARQQFDELAAQECALEDTLESALVRFEGWCVQGSAASRPISRSLARPSSWDGTRAVSAARTSSGGGNSQSSSSRRRAKSNGVLARTETNATSEIREQVLRLDQEIDAAGGPTGGWLDDDHNTFLRLLGKYRKRPGPEFLAEAQQLLPHVTHEDIVGHVAWLSAHEDRQLAKQQLVIRWRGLRAATRAAGSGGEADRPVERDAKQAAEEQQQRVRAHEQKLQEQAKRKLLVEEWRRSKEDHRKKDEQESRRRAREAALRDAMARKREVEEKRVAIQEFRQRRQSDAAAMGAGGGAPRRLSSEERRRVSERNAAQLSRRMDHLANARQRFEPPVRAVISTDAFGHVESRLGAHTEAYIERTRALRATEEEQGPFGAKCGGNFAHQAVIRPVRSSPSWRPHFGV